MPPDFVHNLSEGDTRPKETLDSYVVTPELVDSTPLRLASSGRRLVCEALRRPEITLCQ
jgi:hypothetical protein